MPITSNHREIIENSTYDQLYRMLQENTLYFMEVLRQPITREEEKFIHERMDLILESHRARLPMAEPQTPNAIVPEGNE